MTNSAFRIIRLGVLLAGVVVLTAAMPIKRNLQISSNPSGAKVSIDGKDAGMTTPASLKSVNFRSDVKVRVTVSKENYEAQERLVDYTEVKQARDVFPLNFTLAEIRREIAVQIDADVENCTAVIDEKPVGTTPLKQTLVFTRASGTSAWSSVTLRVEKPPRYQSDVKSVRGEDAAGELRLRFSPVEVRREIPVEIKANVEGATVTVDGIKAGVTPLKQMMVFSRADAKSKWPSLTLKVEKEGYDYRRAGASLPESAFTQTLTTDALQPMINADQFVPVSFVGVPLRAYDVQADQVKVLTTNVFSEVRPREQERAPTPMTTIMPDRPMILSKISPVPDEPDNFVYSMPIKEERPAGSTASEEGFVGANIVMRQKSGLTPLTQGRYYDLDPFVTADRQWVYFSSDRSRVRIIWRVPLSGKGGYTPITGVFTKFDTEPAVSPDGTKLAFTSRMPDSTVNSQSYIWVADSDGKLPTQRWAGRSPAWSPDGKKLAFVSPDNKICVADVDGSTNPTELTLGDAQVVWPIWTPSGKHIVFASNKGFNDRKERNFDIWMMAIEGTMERQLTANGSFDTSPAISSDGKFLFFFSNRGAQRTGQETLQIYRTELMTE